MLLEGDMSESRKSLKPLAPALTPGSSPQPGPQNIEGELRPRRTAVAVACLICRRDKSKCDGRRPKCGRCEARTFECEYDAESGTPRAILMKRKQQALLEEKEELRELYTFLRTRSEPEAIEILRRIRADDDPIAVLKFIKQGDLLLQQYISGVDGEHRHASLAKLDEKAFRSSTIKVQARPWTNVADDGLVSELISSFFKFDYTFYFSFVGKQCFLADMKSGDPATSRYCSALLVNAICSLRCHTSSTAKLYGVALQCDMREKFLEEAKRLYDLEHGRPSLPTVQALLIMYTCSAGMGKDRAGMGHRILAYEMLRRLKLERQFLRLHQNDEQHAHNGDKEAISRALWGMYCFETISAFAYLQPSLIQAPAIPRLFTDGPWNPSISSIIDGAVPDFNLGILNEMCNLSAILNAIMAYNVAQTSELGSHTDIQERMLFFDQIQAWKANLASNLRPENNFTPQTYHLSSYEDKAILGLFRPLRPESILPNGLGTAGDQCILHCKNSIDGLERYARLWSLDIYSIMLVIPLYNSSVTLVALLHQPRTRSLFVRTCALIQQRQQDYPLAAFLLQALHTMAVKLNHALPEASLPYFQGLGLSSETLEDVPISFVLPQHEEIMELLSDDGKDPDRESIGVALGTLITRWSALSLTNGGFSK